MTPLVLQRSPGRLALEHFRVEATRGAVDWERTVATVERALRGRLAIGVRLAERARSYPPSPRAVTSEPSVQILTDASDDATVIEVLGPDRVGLLYELTRALAELDLDVTKAMVATIGADVVDTFYVRDPGGGKVVDPDHLTEIATSLDAVLRPAG